MDVLKIHKNGFKDLVCITPPGCNLSSLSNIRSSDRGKAPGILTPNGEWVGYPWISQSPDGAELKKWIDWDANIGLRSTFFPAIDIDVYEEDLAEVIEELAISVLGKAPQRIGMPPKRLLIYRTEEPFSKRSLKIETEGNKDSMVEVLGEGQQFVVKGIHPKTNQPYNCNPGLDQIKPENLEQIDGKAIGRFFLVLSRQLLQRNIKIKEFSSSKNSCSNIDQEELKGDPNVIAGALSYIPNDTNYDEWVRVGHAIKASLPDQEGEALKLWSKFSVKWENGHTDQDLIEKKFFSFKPPFKVGSDWILGQARQHGFNDAANDFNDELEVPENNLKKIAPIKYSEIALKWHFVKMHRDNFRFMPEIGSFLYWDRTRWKKDDRGITNFEVEKVCTEKSGEALASIEDRNSAERIATRLASGRTVREVIGLLKSDQQLILSINDSDQDPWKLNTPSGTVDLKSGKISKHDPKDQICKSTSVGPDKSVCINWITFLKQATQNNDELISYLQRLCGYSLTGLITEQMLAFLWGPGGNGKGVFLNTISKILGDYTKQTSSEVFMTSKYDRHPTELADLKGARMVVGSEVEHNSKWNESKIKLITGDDAVSARYMRQDFFTYIPQFTLVISGNQKPQLRNIDDAIKRRMHLIPFTNKPVNVDKDLSEKLKNEWPSILQWMLDGWIDWLEKGLRPPPIVLDATSEYFLQEDKLGNWIEECCEEIPNYFTQTSKLFKSWSQWCEINNERKGSKNSLSRNLGERGYLRSQSSKSKARSRGFMGLKLLVDPSEPELEAIE